MSKLNKDELISISANELPLHCPTDEMKLWNTHPRVYLAIEEADNHQATCPYCGTGFILEQS